MDAHYHVLQLQQLFETRAASDH